MSSRMDIDARNVKTTESRNLSEARTSGESKRRIRSTTLAVESNSRQLEKEQGKAKLKEGSDR